MAKWQDGEMAKNGAVLSYNYGSYLYYHFPISPFRHFIISPFRVLNTPQVCLLGCV